MKTVGNMSELIQLNTANEGGCVKTVLMLYFHHPNDGAGIFHLEFSKGLHEHNSGTIISTNKTCPLNWNGDQDRFNSLEGSSNGCWLSFIKEKSVNALWFGVENEKDTDNAIDSTSSIYEAIKYVHSSSIHYI
ncbi:MAG TPA: hypothetical protein VK050_03895 [Flavobacteriaceae bacterium]|nr:hypothetical protein [Flavobacteriaceae bacterium]